ncbi:hypothetical protein [Haloferula rosea]|uniref:Uncharacterized protein n=1 Tax=Haloferula rosea TaxID=490093 RepID=A0A934RBR1_9BACT|nr:hypothetical protein [Haloferula rosea]MBK1828734.1 hypothetical protein [Haloferula rosea]
MAALVLAMSSTLSVARPPKASGSDDQQHSDAKLSDHRTETDAIRNESTRHAATAHDREIGIDARWRGHAPSGRHDTGPASGVAIIEEKSEWQRLWSALNRSGDAPEIDFDEHFIVIGILDDKNRLALDMTLVSAPDGPGDLQIWPSQTMVGHLGSTERSYEIVLIAREGIATVNAQSLKLGVR